MLQNWQCFLFYLVNNFSISNSSLDTSWENETLWVQRKGERMDKIIFNRAKIICESQKVRVKYKAHQLWGTSGLCSWTFTFPNIYKRSSKLSYSRSYIFADDNALNIFHRKLKTLKKQLNIDLKMICHWLNSNKIKLNVEKTEIILLRHQTKKLTTI